MNRIYIQDAGIMTNTNSFVLDQFTFEVLDNIDNTDVIILGQVCDRDYYFIDIFDKLKDNDKLPKIIIVSATEYIHSDIRQRYIKLYSNLEFISPHLDLESYSFDRKIEDSIYSFRVLVPPLYLNKDTYIEHKRTKKFNFLNRAINLRRMKVLELCLKNNLNLESSYTTYGLYVDKKDFTNVNSLGEYVKEKNRRNNILNIDCEFLEENKDKFGLIEDMEWHHRNESFYGTEEYDASFFNSVFEVSLDSYVSFIIESSGDYFFDCRYTEKTIRAWLCKNIFLSLGSNGFNNGLNIRGIETFEDVFGLEKNWDENITELDKVKTFYNCLESFSNLSIEEIDAIYNRPDIQQRLNKNFEIAINALNTNPLKDII